MNFDNFPLDVQASSKKTGKKVLLIDIRKSRSASFELGVLIMTLIRWFSKMSLWQIPA